MEKPSEDNTRVVFTNEPKLSVHEVQSKFNERRIALIPHVRNFIFNHDRFKNREVNVTFARGGVSSLVSIIETDKEKVVLKIPLSKDFSGGEAQFLKMWGQSGVKVPHVKIPRGALGKEGCVV